MLLRFLYSVKSYNFIVWVNLSGSIHFSLSGPTSNDFWRGQLNAHLQHIHKQPLTSIVFCQRNRINAFGLLMPCFLQEKRTRTLSSQSQLQYLYLKKMSRNVALLVVSRLCLLAWMVKIKIWVYWIVHGAKIASIKNATMKYTVFPKGFVYQLCIRESTNAPQMLLLLKCARLLFKKYKIIMKSWKKLLNYLKKNRPVKIFPAICLITLMQLQLHHLILSWVQ